MLWEGNELSDGYTVVKLESPYLVCFHMAATQNAFELCKGWQRERARWFGNDRVSFLSPTPKIVRLFQDSSVHTSSIILDDNSVE